MPPPPCSLPHSSSRRSEPALLYCAGTDCDPSVSGTKRVVGPGPALSTGAFRPRVTKGCGHVSRERRRPRDLDVLPISWSWRGAAYVLRTVLYGHSLLCATDRVVLTQGGVVPGSVAADSTGRGSRDGVFVR
eukprot:1716544-Rhodomonas_salina.1